MHATDTITLKIRELCQAILDDPSFEEIKSSLDTFINNNDAQMQYQQVSQQGNALRQQHSNGEEISDADIAAFESSRESLMANPIAHNYMEAQREMHRIQETVAQYVDKTYELGRVPALEDLEEEGCCGGHDGGGCGCH